MRKLFTFLFLLLTFSVQAQRQQISYIEETKNWYYTSMMSRASVSAVSHVAAWVNLKAGAATFSWQSTIPIITFAMLKERR